MDQIETRYGLEAFSFPKLKAEMNGWLTVSL